MSVISEDSSGSIWPFDSWIMVNPGESTHRNASQACYLQVSMWRGISLAIVAYARRVLEGDVSCREARAKWREAGWWRGWIFFMGKIEVIFPWFGESTRIVSWNILEMIFDMVESLYYVTICQCKADCLHPALQFWPISLSTLSWWACGVPFILGNVSDLFRKGGYLFLSWHS